MTKYSTKITKTASFSCSKGFHNVYHVTSKLDGYIFETFTNKKDAAKYRQNLENLVTLNTLK